MKEKKRAKTKTRSKFYKNWMMNQSMKRYTVKKIERKKKKVESQRTKEAWMPTK